MLCLIDFFSALYLKVIYRHYTSLKKPRMRNIIVILFCAFIFTHIYAFFPLYSAKYDLFAIVFEDQTFHTFILVPYFIGGLFAIFSFIEKKTEKGISNFLTILIYFVPWLLPFGFPVIALKIPFFKENVCLFVIAFFCMIILLFLFSFHANKLFGRFLEKVENSRPNPLVTESIVAGAEGFLLAFYQSLILIAAWTREEGICMIGVYFFLTLIPMRIFTSTSPPYRLLNTIIGIITLFIFFLVLTGLSL